MRAFEKPRMLIADRERIIADAFAIIARRSGYECQIAYSSTRALELVLQFRPHVLVSCLLFGESMHGVDLAIKVSDEFPETGIILFSGAIATFRNCLHQARRERLRLRIL